MTEHNDTPSAQIQDFARYPELRLLDRFHAIPSIVLGLALLQVGGAWALIWGYFVSTTALWHATFSLNSLGHWLGSRRYPTRENSRNNVLVALRRWRCTPRARPESRRPCCCPIRRFWRGCRRWPRRCRWPTGSSLAIARPRPFFVTGSVNMPAPLPVRVSRNMTIVRQGDRLVLVNSVRLDEAGLAALDALGRVTGVMRLAGNHGMDDPFYKDRYAAKVWVVRGQRYTAGTKTGVPQPYFTPDAEMDATTALPLAGAQLYVIDSRPPEGILILEQHDGVAIAGDCLQHWHGHRARKLS